MPIRPTSAASSAKLMITIKSVKEIKLPMNCSGETLVIRMKLGQQEETTQVFGFEKKIY